MAHYVVLELVTRFEVPLIRYEHFYLQIVEAQIDDQRAQLELFDLAFIPDESLRKLVPEDLPLISRQT